MIAKVAFDSREVDRTLDDLSCTTLFDEWEFWTYIDEYCLHEYRWMFTRNEWQVALYLLICTYPLATE